jgi:hypothetical protein
MSDTPKNAAGILAISFLLAVFIAGCLQRKKTTAGQIRGSMDLDRVLFWLPPDTETLLVANGPFWMSNFRTGEDESRNSRVTAEALAKGFEGMTLALFNTKNGILEKHLDGEKVLFAMEASRHFRPTKGLGGARYEGCALAIFKDNLRDRRDAFMKDSAPFALRVEEIEENKVVDLTGDFCTR